MERKPFLTLLSPLSYSLTNFAFITGGFGTWFPELRATCLATVRRIRDAQDARIEAARVLAAAESKQPSQDAPFQPNRKKRRSKTKIEVPIRPPLEGSAFTACTVNLGPCTVCKSHRDMQDWCFIPSGTLAFGEFDGSRGGQIVLHEARLVIHLYPGDVLIFPSSCITHANLPIQEGETRRSLVVYMSGGLARHDAQGHQTREAWMETENGPEEIQAHDAGGEERWESGWALYSTMDDLKKRYRPSGKGAPTK